MTSIKYLVFSTNDQEYAIKSDSIVEIIFYDKVINIPCCPDYVLGIILVRNSVATLVDLVKKLNLKPKKHQESHRKPEAIVVKTDSGNKIAIKVDRCSNLIKPDTIKDNIIINNNTSIVVLDVNNLFD